MFFARRDNNRKKSDLGEIKDAMRLEPIEELPVEELPVERETGAPLFVKVDKYRDLIKSIQELKLYVASTKQVFTVLHETESLRADTLNILRATLQRLERGIIEIDTELLRPYGAGEVTESAEVTHIETSLTDLQKQLLELKRELQEMK